MGAAVPHLGSPFSPQTGTGERHRIAEYGTKAQPRRAFRDSKAIMGQAGGRVESLVGLTWYLADSPCLS